MNSSLWGLWGVEGDSNVTIGWGMRKGNGPWHLVHFINDSRELTSLLAVSIVHVPQDQSVLVDKLANWGVRLPSFFSSSAIRSGCIDLCFVVVPLAP